MVPRDMPRPSRRNNDMSIGLSGCLVVLAIAFGLAFLQAWILMLALGAIAIQTGWNCAFGYWTVYLIMVAVNMVGGSFRTTTSS